MKRIGKVLSEAIDINLRISRNTNELGNDWTAKYRPWKLVYTEKFSNKKSLGQAVFLKGKRARLAAAKKFFPSLCVKIYFKSGRSPSDLIFISNYN